MEYRLPYKLSLQLFYDARYTKVYKIYFIHYIIQPVTMKVKRNDLSSWDI
jgi:hypothetical protein